MDVLAITVGAISVVAWVYLLLARGAFWRAAGKCSTWNNCGKPAAGHENEKNPQPAFQKWERTAVIIPARNEAATVGRAVTSLLRQDYGGELHIIVVDDESDDGTADAARTAASGDKRLTVIRSGPRPAGWTGKVWAMEQGWQAARVWNPAFMLFTDADVVHPPDNLSSLVTAAEAGEYDLVSFMVTLHCEGAAERLLIPAFVFFFFMLYPPRWIVDPKKRTAGAAGGCMLVRTGALERVGGVAAIRGEVIDDCALARRIKHLHRMANSGSDRGAAGGVWLGLSAATKSLREYRSFAEVGRMIARTAFNQLRHSALLLVAALLAMAITFIVPVALVVLGPASAETGQMWGTLAVGFVAWALMTLAYLPTVRFYRLHHFWAVTLPLAASFYMGATLWSAVRYWSGRGGEWKGRAQDQGSRHKRVRLRMIWPCAVRLAP